MELGELKVDYSLAPLYVRAIFLITLGVIGAVVLFFILKKIKLSIRVLASVATALVFLLFSSSTLYSILNPEIKTFTGTFLKAERSAQINPFSSDYVFENAGEKFFIEFDVLTRRHTQSISQEVEKGKTYTVTFEERENIILKLEEAD